MGIGYLQLTVHSESDKYLVGNPQMTHFKSVYLRHTNFAIENYALYPVGDTYMPASSNWGKQFYVDIPKNGDLLHRCYIRIDLGFTKDVKEDGLPENVSEITPNNIEKFMAISALSLIEHVEVTIGDQVIDRHTGHWLHIYNELFLNESKNFQLCQMINLHKILTSKTHNMVYIPLSFWFNRNPGLSLPLLALQYSPVRIHFKLSRKDKVVSNATAVQLASHTQINGIHLVAEFIHLDKAEQRLFSANKHEYLIEQVQYSEKNLVSPRESEEYFHKILLPFNHPVKELFWVFQDENSSQDMNTILHTRTNSATQRFNYWRRLDSATKSSHMKEATVCINGKDVFECRHYNYFLNVQKYQHHSGFGYLDLSSSSLTPTDNSYINSVGSGIYCYSFALNPEEYQPSGTLNFSHIDEAELKVQVYRAADEQTHNKFVQLYALNYNVLRIMSGNGALAFLN